jgi:hypothetical protein
MQDLGTFKAANDGGALPWRRLLQEYARFHHQRIGRQFAVLNSFAGHPRQSRRDFFRIDKPARRGNLNFVDRFIVLRVHVCRRYQEERKNCQFARIEGCGWQTANQGKEESMSQPGQNLNRKRVNLAVIFHDIDIESDGNSLALTNIGMHHTVIR